MSCLYYHCCGEKDFDLKQKTKLNFNTSSLFFDFLKCKITCFLLLDIYIKKVFLLVISYERCVVTLILAVFFGLVTNEYQLVNLVWFLN